MGSKQICAYLWVVIRQADGRVSMKLRRVVDVLRAIRDVHLRVKTPLGHSNISVRTQPNGKDRQEAVVLWATQPSSGRRRPARKVVGSGLGLSPPSGAVRKGLLATCAKALR